MVIPPNMGVIGFDPSEYYYKTILGYIGVVYIRLDSIFFKNVVMVIYEMPR